jgi:hypothetical protein
VYYVASGGGGTLFDRTHPSLKRHFCTDSRYKHYVFNKDGRPKLRNRRTEREKRGFKPISVTEVIEGSERTILKGFWMDNPAFFSLSIRGSYSIDITRPASMKRLADGNLILSCFVAGGTLSYDLSAVWGDSEVA